MKIALSLLLIVTLCACQKTINSGLVAYFPLDGGVEEKQGNAISCIVDGATPTDDRFGVPGSAYYFDGVNDQIFCEIRGMPAIESPQSFCWWYKNESQPRFSDPRGAGNMIVLADSSAGVGIQFGFRAPGYETRGFDGWNWGGKTLLEADHPAHNTWHFCVYAFDGLTHRLYIDGQEEASSTETTQRGIPHILMFGNYPGGDQFLEGKLDVVRIYNRVLTSVEISHLYRKKE